MIDLYWKTGKSDTSIADCLSACMADCFSKADEKKVLSWWEPHPDGAVDQTDLVNLRNSLHPLLRPGLPDFSSSLPVSECRIFFPDGGLHLVDIEGEIRWFAFSQSQIKDCKMSEKIQVLEKKVQLKDRLAFSAFNLDDVSDRFTGQLKLKEFTDSEGLIAWTLLLVKEG